MHKITQEIINNNDLGFKDLTYGDKRDYRKIDIYAIQGRYLCSTTCARTLKEAKEKYAQTNNLTSISYLKASYSK